MKNSKFRPSRFWMSLAASCSAAALVACVPDVVKKAAPPIGKTLGKLDQPAEEILPIIPSEPIAVDAGKAAENYRKLLDLAPDSDTRAESQRRLADLQVQIADTQGNGAETEASLRESLSLYQTLLAEHPEDRQNDRVLYQMARAQQNLGDADTAVRTLQRLTTEFPDSPLIGDARFRRAELLFNLARYAEAETEYAAVMALGADKAFFESAQYKYGWAQYKQSKYEAAIATFFALLDRNLPAGEPGIDVEQALGRVAPAKADLVRDSLRVVTLSLATLGGGSALNDLLTRQGEPRFYPLVYAALGESLKEKIRYSDAAGAYAAFIQRYPASDYAPAFQARIIAVYVDGGFADQVIAEKERYATVYDPDAAYWNGRQITPEVRAELRTHLDDLAKHYHAQAQAAPQARKADFLIAARWYRRILQIYPEDAKLPDINFLLADSLLDGGETLDAAEQYSLTGYGYPGYPRAGEAAHASVLAYQRHAHEVSPDARPQALRSAIDASIKLADTFPAHPEKYAVLTQSAQDLFELKEYDQAVVIAGRVLEAPQSIDPKYKRVAWSVVGDSHFVRERFDAAERAYTEELNLTPENSPEKSEVIERVAASIYKQGEQARAAEDLKAAAGHFLRLGQVTPTSKIRATAEYDGAAALIALKDWPAAARVLENFRSLFPGHALEADVDKKLAVAYQKDNQPAAAAQAYARIARRNSETAEVRNEAAWLSATLYKEAGNRVGAEQAFEYYATTFPRPLDRALEARSELVEYARARGDRAQLERWLNELVRSDETAGSARSDRSRELAAKSSLELGQMAAATARSIPLSLPVEQSLPRKKQAMETAIGWLNKSAAYGYAETTTASTFEVARLYQDFGQSLLKSQRPAGLDALALEQYELLLEEQAYPFEEQAIETHEANLRRIPQGIYDAWIARSAEALATLAPARYGKLEQGETRYETLN